MEQSYFAVQFGRLKNDFLFHSSQSPFSFLLLISLQIEILVLLCFIPSQFVPPFVLTSAAQTSHVFSRNEMNKQIARKHRRKRIESRIAEISGLYCKEFFCIEIVVFR